jgi:hypothetical protein
MKRGSLGMFAGLVAMSASAVACGSPFTETPPDKALRMPLDASEDDPSPDVVAPSPDAPTGIVDGGTGDVVGVVDHGSPDIVAVLDAGHPADTGKTDAVIGKPDAPALCGPVECPAYCEDQSTSDNGVAMCKALGQPTNWIVVDALGSTCPGHAGCCNTGKPWRCETGSAPCVAEFRPSGYIGCSVGYYPSYPGGSLLYCCP